MINKLKNLVKSMLPPPISMKLKEMLTVPKSFDSIKRDLNSYMNLRRIDEKNLSQREILNLSEFKIYSQNGEDGIIQYIFSKIGVKSRKFVEFGIEDGRECNTANLLINNGWTGLLMDGSRKNVKEAMYYYNSKITVRQNQVKIVNCFITKNNINNVLKQNNMSGEIDILSLDIDGNDYWIWREISQISPRLVVIEFNSSLGKELSISVPYDPAFERYSKHPSGNYHGASLSAFNKLAKEKGYILIGCDSTGCNAFFLKKEEAKGRFRELSTSEAFYPHLHRLKRQSEKAQFDIIKHLPFVKI
jgi:hypothetical protein